MRLLVVSVVMSPEQREYAEQLKQWLEQKLSEDEVSAYVSSSITNVPLPD